MCKKITVFPCLNKRVNEAIVKELEPLINKVHIEYVNDFSILKKVVDLPFIKTDDGECFFGVSSIAKFAGTLK